VAYHKVIKWFISKHPKRVTLGVTFSDPEEKHPIPSLVHDFLQRALVHHAGSQAGNRQAVATGIAGESNCGSLVGSHAGTIRWANSPRISSYVHRNVSTRILAWKVLRLIPTRYLLSVSNGHPPRQSVANWAYRKARSRQDSIIYHRFIHYDRTGPRKISNMIIVNPLRLADSE